MLLHGRAVRHAARQLPAALSACGLRVEPDGPPLPQLRRGVGGAVVFELAQATAQALRERPAELLCAALWHGKIATREGRAMFIAEAQSTQSAAE